MRGLIKILAVSQIFLSALAFAKFEFELSDKSKIEVSTQNPPRINSLWHSPKLRLFASASEDLICVWDARNFNQILRLYDENFGNIKEIACPSDFKTLYAAGGEPGESGKVLFINLEKDESAAIAESSDEFLCLAISPDDKYLAAGSADGKLIVFSLPERKAIASDTFEGKKVCSLKFNGASASLAILLSNGQVISRAREDNFKTNGTSFSAGGGTQTLLFLNNAALGFPQNFGYEAAFASVQRFLGRTLRSAKIPIKNPSVAKLRYNTPNAIALANPDGELMTMRPSLDNPNFVFFEKSPSPIIDISPCAAAALIGSTSKGEIFIWDEQSKSISGGIVICDESCQNYALFADSGAVFSSDKNLIKVTSKGGSDITDSAFSEAKTREAISKIGVKNQPKAQAAKGGKKGQNKKSKAK